MNSNVMKAKYCRIVYFHCFYLRNTTELPEKAILYQVGFSRVVFQYPTKKKIEYFHFPRSVSRFRSKINPISEFRSVLFNEDETAKISL